MAFAGENPPVSPFSKGGRLKRLGSLEKNLKCAIRKNSLFDSPSLKKRGQGRF
jgi:hypothetical protein